MSSLDVYSTTLPVGTRLYHGTAYEIPFEFEDDLEGPMWFSTAMAVADRFAAWRGYLQRRLLFRLVAEPYLLYVEDGNTFHEIAEYLAIPLYDSVEDLLEVTERAGFDGWIIPDNYPEGDDIMLLEPERWVVLEGVWPIHDNPPGNRDE